VKTLITGGKGFIGSALARALSECSILDNNSRHSNGRTGADVRDPRHVFTAFDNARPDVVLHCAAINGTKNFYERPFAVLDTQIRGTLNVIDECERFGVQTLVLFSSSEVYQTPPSYPTPEAVPLVVPELTNPRYSYGGSKIAAEQLCWWSRIPQVIIVRPHNVYGPAMGYDHAIPQLIMRAKRAIESLEVRGGTSRAFCFISDLVNGVRAALKAAGDRDVFNIGTDRETGLPWLAQRLLGLFGKSLPVLISPGPDGGTERRCPDISKLRATGWTPQIGLDDGLKQTIDWYLARESEWPAL
jgi:dTDP-glucose 4,6-dehydratase/UDP-glucose 4-epimerase